MPIEFRCTQCGKLLRTGDDTAGRQAQCPECGALSQIPGSNQAADSPPPLAPLGGEKSGTSGNPSGASPTWGDAVGGENPQPWQGPQAFFTPPAQRISAPATALLITGVLGLCIQTLGILYCLAQMTLGFHIANQGPEMAPLMVSTGLNLFFGSIGVVVSIVVIVGAMKMKKLENYSLAMATAAISTIPCLSPCCVLGLPFGIWAMVVLNENSVKAAFRS